MYSLGVLLFGAYALLHWIDELAFHRRRGLSGREWAARVAVTLTVTGAVAYVYFVEYSTARSFVYMAIAMASAAALPFSERATNAFPSPNERALHTVIAMLHPLMLGFLLAVWNFIDGAGFFLNLLLPFSTKNLRPLCVGYLGAIGALALFQLLYWPIAFRLRAARTRAAVEAEPVTVAVAVIEAPALATDTAGLVPVSEDDAKQQAG